MKEGNHSNRDPGPDWLMLVLIALICFGLAVAVSAHFLPHSPLPLPPNPTGTP